MFSESGCVQPIKSRELILRFFLKFKEKGTCATGRLVVLTSNDAHYSIKKACFLLGIGASNLYLVNVDSDGRMDLVHLREEVKRALNEGAIPFMVSATAGTYNLPVVKPTSYYLRFIHRNDRIRLNWSSWWNCWHLSRIRTMDACRRSMGRRSAYVHNPSPYSKRNWAVKISKSSRKQAKLWIIKHFTNQSRFGDLEPP